MNRIKFLKIIGMIALSINLMACNMTDMERFLTSPSLDIGGGAEEVDELNQAEGEVLIEGNSEDLSEGSDVKLKNDVEVNKNQADAPDYALVFPDDKVNSILITIDPENWQIMQDDMTSLYGEFGSNQNDMRPGRPPMDQQGNSLGQRPVQNNEVIPQNQVPAQDDGGQVAPGQMPQGERPGLMMGIDENPVWVPATVSFEGEEWAYVGIRYKGNSSLKSSWSSGNMKIPFKLDFDEFEDTYPETEDQRFYGFKQLSFSSGFDDVSLMREKIMADLFRENGVVAANTAFYEVYIDYGQGPEYFGLYTMVEVIDDTVIEEQFESDEGNVYKPEGNGATFAEGSFNEQSFDKETNQEESDYSDIQALFAVLHAENRLTDPTTWRAQLESVLDVEGFLNWLAINTTAQNWDTYGNTQHNYYLYHDPTSDLLTWIPWDNNESLKDVARKMTPLSLSMDEVGDKWPLISYLLEDEVYYAKYLDYMEAFIENSFNPENLIPLYQETHALISPYVIGENGEEVGYTNLKSEQEFEIGLTGLIQHVNLRIKEVAEFLQSQD
ncbi:MAG: CotH kinase family protein [Anaerolineaceae bacterium]|nr:CotH kinase family protein [Anaerolineaceae bacterium]